jgi:hypothetical protein
MSGPEQPHGEGPDEPRPAGPDETHGSEAPQGPGLGSGQQAEPPAVGGVPAVPDGGEADGSLPWRAGEARLAAPVIRTGIFGVRGTPDTSGYGRLRVHRAPLIDSPRPYGSYFDAGADGLGDALQQAGIGLSDAVEHGHAGQSCTSSRKAAAGRSPPGLRGSCHGCARRRASSAANARTCPYGRW